MHDGQGELVYDDLPVIPSTEWPISLPCTRPVFSQESHCLPFPEFAVHGHFWPQKPFVCKT
jgi:hypothetical protein